MWPNPQKTADLVTFAEEIRNRKLHFLRSVTGKCIKLEFEMNIGNEYRKKIETIQELLFSTL